jgi:hypothetical protein
VRKPHERSSKSEKSSKSTDRKALGSIKKEITDLRRQMASIEVLRRQASSVDALQREMAELKTKIWGASALSLALIPLKPQASGAVEPTTVRLKLPDFSELRRELPELPNNPATASRPAVIEERAIEQVRPKSAVEEAKTYLIATATPGYTMVRQGVDVAIGRLHPDFVVKLASAIKLARASGLAGTGVFSAYRPPAFGVGCFSDKFSSLHSYGLAADIIGIGRPGSRSAHLWESIVQQVGLYVPYGANNRLEFNHTQLVPAKGAPQVLRATITASEPKDLQRMWLASGIKAFVGAGAEPPAPALVASGAAQDQVGEGKGAVPVETTEAAQEERRPARGGAPKRAGPRRSTSRSGRGRASTRASREPAATKSKVRGGR